MVNKSRFKSPTSSAFTNAGYSKWILYCHILWVRKYALVLVNQLQNKKAPTVLIVLPSHDNIHLLSLHYITQQIFLPPSLLQISLLYLQSSYKPNQNMLYKLQNENSTRKADLIDNCRHSLQYKQRCTDLIPPNHNYGIRITWRTVSNYLRSGQNLFPNPDNLLNPAAPEGCYRHQMSWGYHSSIPDTNTVQRPFRGEWISFNY